MDVEEALELCDRIVEMIDDEVPEHAWDKAGDFFEDVREKVVEVRETIERTDDVTDRQAAALDNWESGVNKWIR